MADRLTQGSQGTAHRSEKQGCKVLDFVDFTCYATFRLDILNMENPTEGGIFQQLRDIYDQHGFQKIILAPQDSELVDNSVNETG